MKLCAVIVAVLLAVCTARADTLLTADGRLLEGRAGFDGTAVMLTPSAGPAVRVELENVIVLRVDPPAELTVAGRLKRGVVLTSGDVVPLEAIVRLEGKTLRTVRSGGVTLDVPIETVAVLVMDGLGASARFPDTDAPGVLLKSEDFFEGELLAAGEGRWTIGSTLFGDRTFDAAREVVAARLRAVVPGVGGSTLVRLIDGTVSRPTAVSLKAGELVFTDRSVGPMTAGRGQLLELRPGGARLLPLDFGPTEGTLRARGGAMLRGPSAVWWSTGSRTVLTLDAETAVTLDPTATAVFLRVGVPSDLLPGQQIRFVVSLDGKPVSRTTLLSSVDDAVALVVPCQGGQRLAIRIESESGPQGAAGVVADAVQVTR